MSNCDINNCHKHALHTLEDMSDGEYVAVCGKHFRILMLKGGFRQL